MPASSVICTASRPAGSEFVEGVVIRRRSQHAGFTHAQRPDQIYILGGRANPSGRLDRRAPTISFQRAFQRQAIRLAIGEKLRLADRAGRAGEAAHDVIDGEALLGRQWQPALLAVAVRRLGCPHFRWQVRRALGPDVLRKGVAWKRLQEIFRRGGIGDGGHGRCSFACVYAYSEL
jgi:hypothetical protein